MPLEAARRGDMSKARAARSRLRENRAEVLNEMGFHPPETGRLLGLLTESRNSEAEVNWDVSCLAIHIPR